MTLRIVGSSSAGNGYLLEANDGSQLILEVGCPSRAFRKYGGMHTADVKAALVSHSHGDHAKYAKEFARAGIGVYSTGELSEKCAGCNPCRRGNLRIWRLSGDPFRGGTRRAMLRLSCVPS